MPGSLGTSMEKINRQTQSGLKLARLRGRVERQECNDIKVLKRTTNKQTNKQKNYVRVDRKTIKAAEADR